MRCEPSPRNGTAILPRSTATSRCSRAHRPPVHARGSVVSVAVRRVLIANRGEIALRIVRACHEEGLEAVAVYSAADRASPHVRAADHAVSIGPPPAAESYLAMDKLLAAA